MINQVVLVGRLTRDPELRRTNSGNSVCSFTIALDNIQKNPDGSKGTTFINCTVFQQQADNMSKFTRKGAMVGVEGRLNQRNYVRADGSKGSAIEVLCNRVTFLEPKGTGEEIVDNTVVQDDLSAQDENKNLDSLDLPDDDLPF